jgi:hypothetical protein|nr:hypothetical protein [Candidatus Acidoferrales bacterium]
MSEPEAAKPRIAETFIAAYYLSIFFQYTPFGLITLAWRWRYFSRWRLFFGWPFFALLGLGIVCLAVGVSLLRQRNWAKTAAVFLSGILTIALLVPFLTFVAPRGAALLPRPNYPWPTMLVHLVMNAGIVWYLARS